MTADAAPRAPGAGGAAVARRGLTAIDRLVLAYLAANTALVLWHAPRVAWWPLLLGANALTLVLIRLIARAPETRLMVFLGGAYPLILTLAYYTQLGVINTDVGRIHDLVIQGWDRAIFGSEVSVTWHERMPSALLSTVLHFCYGSYYWLVPCAGFALFFRASRQAYEHGMFLIALSLYVCYLAFALFPVAGPRYFFGVATGPAAEVLTARLVHSVLEGGSAYGTAFPSSHVAAAWCAAAALWPALRRLSLALGLIAVGLAFGTVYGQFHYGVDALAGAALATVLVAAAPRLRRLLGATA